MAGWVAAGALSHLATLSPRPGMGELPSVWEASMHTHHGLGLHTSATLAEQEGEALQPGG